MELTTRPATPEDTGAARRLHHAAYRDVVERQFGAWDEPAQDGFFAGDWAIGGFAMVLSRGAVAGYCAIDRRTDDVHVRELVIDPAYQGRGIGTRLLRDAIAEASERGVPVRLRALHRNRAAELYRRLGFREVGRTATHTLFERCP